MIEKIKDEPVTVKCLFAAQLCMKLHQMGICLFHCKRQCDPIPYTLIGNLIILAGNWSQTKFPAVYKLIPERDANLYL